MISSLMAHFIQNDFGHINIQMLSIVDEEGNSVEGKIYIPFSATEKNPQPGILLLHGFNNDKDTEGPAALELARRGFVSLTISQLGHGYSVGDKAFDISILLDQGSMTLGANESYKYLKNLPFVDGTQIGIVGHSMGGWVAVNLARTNPDHRAIVIQAGGPLNLTESGDLNNYLSVWPHYEELFSTQDRKAFVSDGLKMIEYNTGEIGELDKTYGDFTDGTAQRYVLCESTHPGGTWNSEGIQATCDWMIQALKNGDLNEGTPDSSQQTYLFKEILTLIALTSLILSVLPLISILLGKKYFNEVKQPIPKEISLSDKKGWWKTATINTTIGALTFLFIPMIGMAIGIFIPFFNLITGNGLLLWLLLNAFICWKLFKKWYFNNKNELGMTSFHLGISFSQDKLEIDKSILGKTILIGAIIFIYMYTMVSIIQLSLDVELRYMWSVFKQFNGPRLGQFFLYLLPVLVFFMVNGGVFLFGQLRQEEYGSKAKTEIIWTLKNIYAMLFGLIVIFCLQYAPMILFGTPPFFGAVFTAGLFLIFLMQILPFFAIILFLMTDLYQRTGKIYLGALIGTLLTVWLMSGGSALG